MFSVFPSYFYILAIVTYPPNKWFWNRDVNLTFAFNMGMCSSSSTVKWSGIGLVATGLWLRYNLNLQRDGRTDRHTQNKYFPILRHWHTEMAEETFRTWDSSRKLSSFFPSKWTFSCIHTFCWHKPRAVTQGATFQAITIWFFKWYKVQPHFRRTMWKML